MCDPLSMTLVGGAAGMQMFSQQQQLSAKQSMQNYQAQVESNNAAVAMQQEQNAERQGQLALQQQQVKNAMTLGNAKAQMAANGLDLSMGTPMDVQNSDAYLGNLDATNIRNNTVNQAYGYDVSAMNHQASAQADQFQADMTGMEQNMGLAQMGWKGLGYGLGPNGIGSLSSSFGGSSAYGSALS